MTTLTISLPDPAALCWHERQMIRAQAADEHRAESGTKEDVGVDIVVSDERWGRAG